MRHRTFTAGLAALTLTTGLVAASTTGSASAAPGDRAPSAPTRLTVDDVAKPLNTTLEPRFGWLPQDQDGAEAQTAYEIEVSAADGTAVWDSGKVESAQESYVDYDGAELENGSAYTWRVRTWDEDDQVSRWSSTATFETGLDDGDWGGAAWIKRPPGGDGPLEIIDGRVRVTGGGVTIATVGHDWTDYVVSMQVTPVSGGAGIVSRAPDADRGYMWQLSSSDEALKTHTLVDGGFPTSGRRTVPLDGGVASGTSYDVSIRVEGQTFETSVDGEVVDTWTDPAADAPTAGTIGFREANGEIGEFDDVTVETLDGTVLFEDDFSGNLDQWQVTRTQEPDEYTLARQEVDLPEGEITRARSYVAGSHTYELYLNGERADRGQSFAYPGEGYYQAADVTELVDAGEPLALGALLHWYGAGQGRPAGEPGLLVRLVVDYADGRQVDVVSDGTWRVRRGPYQLEGRRNGEGLWIEHKDGAAAAAIGAWDEPGYDDSSWSDVVVLGEHPTEPFTTLIGQETRMTESEVPAERILVADDGTPVADFGRIIPARPSIRFDDGEAGREITARASYLLADDGRVSTSRIATQGTDMRFLYTQAEGEQTFDAFEHLGFRYLEIPDAGEEITVDDVSATIVHTRVPMKAKAKFSSSNETLNEVFDLMYDSALYSVQEQFVDTPTREKGQFLGDAVNISYALMATAGDRVATRQAIREFLNSQERYWASGNDAGRYNAVYPNGDGKRDIPDYSELMPNWVWRYYLETGDRNMLEEASPALLATAAYVRRHIPEDGPTAGLVTNLSGGSGPYRYGIVDWPVHGRFGYDMETAARTTVNALGVDVLRKTAAIAEVLGESDADVLTTDADALADRMNATLRRPDGVYVDGLTEDGEQSAHAGQHSTSYALAFGIAPEEDRAALAEHIGSLGMRQGPMTSHWLLDGLAAGGNDAAVLDLLTNPDDYGWAQVLAEGGTFTPEAWEPDSSANSLSHGWGAQAIVDIVETVLGIEVTDPGAAEVRISVPDVNLRRASGSIETQRGEVRSAWIREEGVQAGVDLRVSIPVNVTAVVELPEDDYEMKSPKGATVEELGTADGLARYRIGSGDWSFR
jgi:alpha-L-rhamnosidase